MRNNFKEIISTVGKYFLYLHAPFPFIWKEYLPHHSQSTGCPHPKDVNMLCGSEWIWLILFTFFYRNAEVGVAHHIQGSIQGILKTSCNKPGRSWKHGDNKFIVAIKRNGARPLRNSDRTGLLSETLLFYSEGHIVKKLLFTAVWEFFQVCCLFYL